MRALLERSRSARAAVVLIALGTVLAVMRGATAGDDSGLRRTLFSDDLPPTLRLAAASPAVARHRHHARRIWAASRSRPLRITLAHRAPRSRFAAAHRGPMGVPSRLPAFAEPQVVFPRLARLSKAPRPVLVSIYQDRTLRNGDAVMMADGIHVFRASGAWPHRPGDFVRLAFAAALDWRLRETLDALDRNPPTLWSSAGSSAG